uniref:Uncharacterized protein n=1 Tax=Setaria italica TaxID=4555 RepID=K3YKH8_SETIT
MNAPFHRLQLSLIAGRILLSKVSGLRQLPHPVTTWTRGCSTEKIANAVRESIKKQEASLRRRMKDLDDKYSSELQTHKVAYLYLTFLS